MLEKTLGFWERWIMRWRRICYYFVGVMFGAVSVGIILVSVLGIVKVG
jgi:hypothetical protein